MRAMTQVLLQSFADIPGCQGRLAMVLAAGWQGEFAVDLDEAASRVVYEVLDIAHKAPADLRGVDLVLIARGGQAGFAEATSRLFRSLGLEFRVLVPTRITGEFTQLALGAEQVLFHPMGSLGAYDAGPLVEPSAAWDIQMAESLGKQDWGDLPVSKGDFARIAASAHARKLARHSAQRLASYGTNDVRELAAQLSARELGHQGALDAKSLQALGLRAALAGEELARWMWNIYGVYEQELGLLSAPTARYHASDWADEVEFEPAMDVPGAIIETLRRRATYVLDTGSPEPDARRLKGRWTL